MFKRLFPDDPSSQNQEIRSGPALEREFAPYSYALLPLVS
jgi:hypothetical protein